MQSNPYGRVFLRSGGILWARLQNKNEESDASVAPTSDTGQSDLCVRCLSTIHHYPWIAVCPSCLFFSPSPPSSPSFIIYVFLFLLFIYLFIFFPFRSSPSARCHEKVRLNIDFMPVIKPVFLAWVNCVLRATASRDNRSSGRGGAYWNAPSTSQFYFDRLSNRNRAGFVGVVALPNRGRSV